MYELYFDKLVIISERLTHDRNASEDIVQETFTLIWKKHKELGQSHQLSIQRYLVKIVQNKSIDFYWARTEKEMLHAAYLERTGATTREVPSESKLIATEKSILLRNIIASFPPKEKQCLLMQLDHEMKVGDIATHLGVTVKAVEARLTSAKKRLKKYKASLE